MVSQVALLVLLGACSAEIDTLTIDEFPAAYQNAVCGYAVDCGYTTDATCRAEVALDEYQLATIVADVKAGIVQFDGEKASTCLASFDACAWTGAKGTADLACYTYLLGTVPQGGTCFLDVECVGLGFCTYNDATCDSTVACCTGTCGPPNSINVAVGGACGTTAGCAANAYCASDNTCKALQQTAGGACDDAYGCANPMICSNFSGAGTCYTPAARGATCSNALGDVGYRCADERDYCEPTSGTCVARPGVGAACSADAPCSGASGCFNGKCVANAGKGQPCNNSTGPYCDLLTVCEGGSCVAESAGQACR